MMIDFAGLGLFAYWGTKNHSSVYKAAIVEHKKPGKSLLGYAALVMVPPAWSSTITGVSNQLISGSEP